MQGSLDAPPLILRKSRAKSLGMLALCATFVALLVWTAQVDPDHDRALAIGGAVFSGLGLPLFGWELYRPDRLTLGPDGLAWTGPWRTRRYRWTDLSAFSVLRIRGSALIGFSELNRPKANWLAALNKGLLGQEGGFPGLWEIGPQEVCDLLNAARDRWGGAETR